MLDEVAHEVAHYGHINSDIPPSRVSPGFLFSFLIRPAF